MMASVSIDSELMTNYVAAVPVPAGSHFVTVLDEKRLPMVFCLSKDQIPKLQLLRRNEQGHSELLDMGLALQLPPDAAIQTFQVEQAWFIVVKPFAPDVLKSGVLLDTATGPETMGTVEKIYMTPVPDSSGSSRFPEVFVAHKTMDQLESWGSDITRVSVEKYGRWWSKSTETSPPENTSAILDIAPAVSVFGQGLYVLYKNGGRSKIFARFWRPDPNSKTGNMFQFTTLVQCPPDAKCIASIVGDGGQSCLFIASSEGLRYLNAIEATEKDRPGKLLWDQPLLKNIEELTVSQDQSAVSLWFSNDKHQLGYARAKTEEIENAVVSMLLSEGQASSFGACISSPDPLTGNTSRQMLITNDDSGKLLLLEQSSDNGLWRKTPFYAPSNTVSTEVPSYTITIKVQGADEQPLANSKIQLSAASTVSAMLNGRHMLLTQGDEWYNADSTGALNFIIPTDSLGAQALKINRVQTVNGSMLSFAPTTFDPAAKPMAALKKNLDETSNASDFGKARTQSNRPLFPDGAMPDQKTLEGAHNCLKLVAQAYTAVPGDGSSVLSSSPTASRLVSEARAASNDFGDLLMDGWHWIRQQAESIVDWAVDTAGAVWKFVCKIAGEIKQFVLDCAEKICEAATWVWEKLKVGWEALCDFVGFIFSWDDILTTKDTISSLFTAGFGYAADKVDFAVGKVDEVFDNLESTIDEFGKSIQSQKQLSTSKGNSDQKVNDAQSSTSCNWASERLKNGGAGTSSKVKTDEKPANDAQNLWADVVQPAMSNVTKELQIVGNRISTLFKQEGSVTSAQIIDLSKSALKVAVVAVREVIKDVLKAVKWLLQKLARLGNAEIDIPIFSWLYKKISGGHALTLFDAISLVIAIPTTVFAKLITGKAPPTIPDLTPSLLGKILNDDKTVDSSVKTDFSTLKVEIAVGATLTSAVIAVLKLLWKAATAGLDEVLDGLNTGPSSLFDIFGICIDMIGAVMAIPDQKGLPGEEYRNWISCITYTRGAYHVVAYFAKLGDAGEKVVLALDLIVTLANFGLSIAVANAEDEAATTWPDYDADENNTALISSGLNAIAGVAYFTAFFFKNIEPNTSLVGAAVMTGTIAGTAFLEGVVFRMQYDKTKRARLLTPASF